MRNDARSPQPVQGSPEGRPRADRPLAGAGQSLHRGDLRRLRLRLAADRCGTRAERPAAAGRAAAGDEGLAERGGDPPARRRAVGPEAAARHRRADAARAHDRERGPGPGHGARRPLSAAGDARRRGGARPRLGLRPDPRLSFDGRRRDLSPAAGGEPRGTLGARRDRRGRGVDGVFIGPSDLAADMGHLGRPGRHRSRWRSNGRSVASAPRARRRGS